MKKLRQTFLLMLALMMFLSSVPVYAENANGSEGEQSGTVNYMFGTNEAAYATDIEYIAELSDGSGSTGLYVTGGKGFYTSADGINWTARTEAESMTLVQNETYGFTYGGPADNRYFLIIPDTTSTNTALVMNQTMTAVTEMYTYTNIQAADGSGTTSTPLHLKGVIEWDAYSGKFWCGAALADGTMAGLYYSDGTYTLDASSGQYQMVWIKADYGTSALVAESTDYFTATGTADTMATVIGNITSDDKGHLVAVGVWANKLSSGDAYSNLTNGSGGLTCKTALLVNISASDIQTQLCDFSAFSTGAGLSTAVIDKKSNIIIQDTTTYKILVFYHDTFGDLWGLGNNGKPATTTMNAVKYAVNPYPGASSNCIHTNNLTNALSEIVCLDEMLLLIPRSGQGVGGNNHISDIFVVTYNTDGTLKNRFLPFINNQETAKKLMGDYYSYSTNKVTADINMYIADAVAGPNGKVVLITGKYEKAIATEQAYATTVAVIDTTNTVTDSTTSYATTAIPDRTEKITITSPVTVSIPQTATPTVASVNGMGYATLQEAIEAATEAAKSATENVVITLLDHIVYKEILEINEGITLDLKGKTLTASGSVTFGGNVVDNSDDKAGLLKVDSTKCVFSKTNTQMPVYNGEGYVFATITPQETFSSEGENDSTVYNLIFRPYFGSETTIQNALSTTGNGIDDQFNVIIRLTWTVGTEQKTQDLVYKDEMVQQVYDNNKAFYINASGVTSFEGLTITPMVVSKGKGVAWSGTSFPEVTTTK
ncbi:MAG: hypothetical protein IKJ16_07455 [Agathobacter sp.]|nr:hypothetical protein [Lachnospiraceae bacterium]MBR3812142.1 hypothetical protein [Agathobacter sp.]